MKISLQKMTAGIRWVLVPIHVGIFGVLILVAARFICDLIEFVRGGRSTKVRLRSISLPAFLP